LHSISVETTCPALSMSYFDFEHADYDAINEYLAVTDWNDIFSHSITVLVLIYAPSASVSSDLKALYKSVIIIIIIIIIFLFLMSLLKLLRCTLAKQNERLLITLAILGKCKKEKLYYGNAGDCLDCLGISLLIALLLLVVRLLLINSMPPGNWL